MDLHHKVYGSGEIVVILHGLFGMSDNWKSLAAKLASDYSVVIIDLPNHGRSPRLDTFDIPHIAEVVYDFLTHHWMYEIRLVGHSLGAKVAMTLALHYPDLVDKLVSVDMGPQAYSIQGHEDIFNTLLSLDLNHLSSRQAADDHLKTQVPDERTRRFLLKNLKRRGDHFEWKFDLTTLYRDYPKYTQAIPKGEVYDKPSLFLRGGQSNYLDYSIHENQIKNLFPNAELASIENAGHWVHVDQPEEMERMLRTFLQKKIN